MPYGSGDLRHRITIKEKTTSIDEEGFSQEVWAPVCTVWDRAENLRGREYFEAAAVQAERTVRFAIRYRDGLDTSMRIDFDGREYSITHLDHVEYRGAYMEILAMEVTQSGA